MKIDNTVLQIVESILMGLSTIADSVDSREQDLFDYFGVTNSSNFDSVLDSLYLLEDTELAKQEFLKIDPEQESTGRLYLLYYGVLNACYIQQQGLKVICREMKVDLLEDVNKPSIIEFRNDFAAHSPNRGWKVCHSLILDRSGLSEMRLRGYSSNHPDGLQFKDAGVLFLLEEWGKAVMSQLRLIQSEIAKDNSVEKGVI